MSFAVTFLTAASSGFLPAYGTTVINGATALDGAGSAMLPDLSFLPQTKLFGNVFAFIVFVSSFGLCGEVCVAVFNVDFAVYRRVYFIGGCIGARFNAVGRFLRTKCSNTAALLK